MPRGKRAGGKRRGRPSFLESLPTSALIQELDRRRSKLQDLIRQRQELESEVQELQSAFGTPVTNGAAAPTRGRRARSGRGSRGPRENSLAGTLQRVLSGQTMSVSDAVDAVQKAGYKSKSPNLRNMVNVALFSHRNLFRKVARGQYTAK